jgi:apolipoprotein D and lipocalin family protein
MSNAEIEKMTVPKVDIQKFMGNWKVLAGRFTFLEKDVHNGIEIYTWNEEKERIDIGFTYNKGSFDGPLKSIPQKGWIENKTTNSHWKVSPIWPIKADYLILAVADDYSWTAIGVPNQKYLWIMARTTTNQDDTIKTALKAVELKNYRTDEIVRVPHKN